MKTSQEYENEIAELKADNERLKERLITFFTENLPGAMRFKDAFELRERLKSYLENK